VRELQRLLGKKTMENELLREAVSRAAGPKKQLLRSNSWPEGGAVSAVADAVGVSRPHLSAMQRPKERCRRGRHHLPDAELVADIRRLIVESAT